MARRKTRIASWRQRTGRDPIFVPIAQVRNLVQTLSRDFGVRLAKPSGDLSALRILKSRRAH